MPLLASRMLSSSAEGNEPQEFVQTDSRLRYDTWSRLSRHLTVSVFLQLPSLPSGIDIRLCEGILFIPKVRASNGDGCASAVGYCFRSLHDELKSSEGNEWHQRRAERLDHHNRVEQVRVQVNSLRFTFRLSCSLRNEQGRRSK